MHHKKRKVKQSRAGYCGICHPSKNSHNKTADRMKDRRDAFKLEQKAY